jgi:hypothetical protein
MEFSGYISGGKLRLHHREAFKAAVQKSDGQRVTIKIGARKRSLPQNSYYWSVVLGIISAETGHSVDELHEYFKAKFLGYSTAKILGEFVGVPQSTTRLSTQEFSDYIERIRAWAAGDPLLISIPEPGE